MSLQILLEGEHKITNILLNFSMFLLSVAFYSLKLRHGRLTVVTNVVECIKPVTYNNSKYDIKYKYTTNFKRIIWKEIFCQCLKIMVSTKRKLRRIKYIIYIHETYYN